MTCFGPSETISLLTTEHGYGCVEGSYAGQTPLGAEEITKALSRLWQVKLSKSSPVNSKTEGI